MPPLPAPILIEDMLFSHSDDRIAEVTGLTFEQIIGLRGLKAAGALRTDPHWQDAISQLDRPLN